MDEPPYTCEASEIMNKLDTGEMPETPAKEQGYSPLDATTCSVLRADQVTQEGWYWWRWLPSEPWGVGMVRVIRLHGQLCTGERPGEKLHGEFVGPLSPPNNQTQQPRNEA